MRGSSWDEEEAGLEGDGWEGSGLGLGEEERLKCLNIVLS